MIEQVTLLSKYMQNQSATYTTEVRQCNKRTISSPDNKVYMLASPNNRTYKTIGREHNNRLY